MNAKDRIVVNNVTYEVLEPVGSGGQGAVWKVRCASNNQIYALKIINEKDPNRRLNKVNNIKRLVNEKADQKLEAAVANGLVQGINHACPISYYVDPVTRDTGYIMELGEGKTLNSLLINGTIERMSIQQKLNLLKKIAASIDVLHTMGYCYTDINWGNFMWNDKTDTLYVIDCENMACRADILSGKCSFLIGTGFFIAPEVAFGKAKAEYNSDKYALASLIFRILTNNVLQSAYHGVAMYSAVPACQTMMDVADMDDEGDIDPNWRKFIFDPNDRSNGLDNLCKNSKNPENIAFRKNVEKVIEIWAKLDSRLKNLFYQAFADPFDANRRPLPYTWVREIDKIVPSSGKHVRKPAHVPVPTPSPTIKYVFMATPKAVQTPAQTPQPALTPKPAPAPTPKPASNPQSKYRAFKPAGGTVATVAKPTPQVATTLPNKPYLISTANQAVAITADDFAVEGAKLGLKQTLLGRVKKSGSEFVFTSQLLSAIEILDTNGRVRGKLYKGQETTLSSGEGVKPVVSTVAVKIIY